MVVTAATPGPYAQTILTLENKLIAGFVSTSLVVFLALVSAWVARDLQRWQAWRNHSVEVLLQVSDIRAAANGADAARRLYEVSGSELQLPAYFAESALVDEELKVLRAMVADDAAQSRAVGHLSRAAYAVLAKMDHEISQRALQRDLLGIELPITDVESFNRLAEFYQHSEDIEHRELQYREERMGQERQTSRRLLAIVLLGCLVSTLLNISIQISIRHDVLARAEDARVIAEQGERLAEAHGVLEHRVEALTAANHIIAENSRDLALVRRALERKVKELDRSNKDLAQFAYVVSHDLKSPLRGISSLATWIEEDAAESLTGDARRHLEMMRDRVSRLEAMIEGILSYSRAGWAGADTTATTVEAIFDEVKALIEAPEGVEVAFTTPAMDIESPTVQLQQVLLNLVGNAIKYGCPEGGRVDVSAADVDDTWFRVTVRDHGPGIDPRHHQRVFALFQTLQPKDASSSTGIGLAVVKKLVDQQGGEISLRSHRGEGAAFSFTWPKRVLPQEPSQSSMLAPGLSIANETTAPRFGSASSNSETSGPHRGRPAGPEAASGPSLSLSTSLSGDEESTASTASTPSLPT